MRGTLVALKFKCNHCSEYIIVKYLKVGEEAKCLNCGEISVVPENNILTDEEPNPLNYGPLKVYTTKKPSIFKPSGKQLLISIVISTALTFIGQSLTKDSDSAIGYLYYFVILFIIAYISSFLSLVRIKDEKEIQKFSRNIAYKDGKCANCKKNIVKGEPVFIKPDIIARLLKEEIVLCMNCYNDFKLSLMKKRIN